MKNRSVVIALAAIACLSADCGCSSSADPAAGGKKFYRVQPLKGNPTHQLTQMGFAEGCRKLGYRCVIVGSDEDDAGATTALAEQALATGEVAGMSIWTGSTAYNPLIAKAKQAGVPVVLPHFPPPEGENPGASGIVGGDPAECGSLAAEAMGKAIGGKGTVAITQGSINSTENAVSDSFTKTMAKKFPAVQVLPVRVEGFDASPAIALAVQLIQSHLDLVGAISSTGNGAQNWAAAQKKSGRKLTLIGMNYTRPNLDLVKSGEVYAVMGQPMWEESYQAAELLDKLVHKQRIPWWTKLPTPVITRDNVEQFYKFPDKVEAALKR